MTTYIVDLETNGLLEEVTKIHCLVINDMDNNKIHTFVGDKVEEGIREIAKLSTTGNKLVMHNGIKYDIPVIQKLYPDVHINPEAIIDTLVLARLIYANIGDHDADLMRRGKLPGKLFGSHSLEAWGYRLGNYKGEYTGGWEEFSQEMLDYNIQDTVVTLALYAKLLTKEYSQQSIDLEHSVAWLMAKQERNGFCFDEKAAAELYSKLIIRKTELQAQCEELFPPWEIRVKDFIPKANNKPRGYIKGVPVQKFKTVVFNPSSRDHIADRLQKLYGWKPDVLTEGGKPKVDEAVLAKLDYPPCKLLSEYLMVQKRISQLAEGDQAWLQLVRNGKIHGSINTNGAVTGRATHSRPNISQVPSSNSPYGHECRALFTVPSGWTLVGADASGLELRCLSHYMAKYDGGEYGRALLEGDIHTKNQEAAGLETRAQAKTFIYAFLYGAGDEKIGSICGGSKVQGEQLRNRFLRNLPALARLTDGVKEAAGKGYLNGLDGRRIHVRSAHAALNTLLQGAGAVICKQWLVLLEEHLQAQGLKHGWDGDYAFCAWSHDECQIACRTPEIAAIVAELATKCVTLAGEHFNFRCPTAGEAKIGINWSETH
jgi:DNA polymerase I-like protein with 3'-5' exonuclease and polymerase domains